MLPVAEPRLWSPEDPYLYHVDAELISADGTDRVAAYTGLRRIEVIGEDLHLNGRRLFVRGVLDQGYWPRTGITAPDDAALRHDIELAAAAGYNLVRKHLKLEDPRFVHHADLLGMLVWAEPAATGRFSPESVAAFEEQIAPMVERDGNSPAIVIWGLYNEEWGLDWDIPGDPAKQEATARAYDLLKALDPTRPAVDNSGWTHVRTDLLDWHYYDESAASWGRTVAALLDGEQDDFPVRLGPDYVVRKKLAGVPSQPLRGLPNLNSEYGGGFTCVERAWHLRWQTQELRRHDRLAGYVYTELYDVEHESAGLLDFEPAAQGPGRRGPGGRERHDRARPRRRPGRARPRPAQRGARGHRARPRLAPRDRAGQRPPAHGLDPRLRPRTGLSGLARRVGRAGRARRVGLAGRSGCRGSVDRGQAVPAQRPRRGPRRAAGRLVERAAAPRPGQRRHRARPLGRGRGHPHRFRHRRRPALTVRAGRGSCDGKVAGRPDQGTSNQFWVMLEGLHRTPKTWFW